jgi:hypothetical protein
LVRLVTTEEWVVPPVVLKRWSMKLYAMFWATSYLQVAFSSVPRVRVVWVVPDGRVPDGAPEDLTGAVVSAGGVLGETVMETDWLAEPPAPEQVRVYVVFTAGVTTWLPLVALAPDQPLEAVQEVALVELQVRRRFWPTVILEMEGVRVTVGAGVLETVTETLVAVVVFPAASLATAERVWVPLVLFMVFQETEYGEAVSSAPRATPSSLNWTPATPTLSEAVAVMFVVPETVPEGEVMETEGGVESTGAVTVTVVDWLLDPPVPVQLRV